MIMAGLRWPDFGWGFWLESRWRDFGWHMVVGFALESGPGIFAGIRCRISAGISVVGFGLASGGGILAGIRWQDFGW